MKNLSRFLLHLSLMRYNMSVNQGEEVFMALQTVFKRYEMKYMITVEQKNALLAAISPYMQLDRYGRTTIRNIYFDTDNFRLIRRSIEKPVYKEKLRVRSYSLATPESRVFVELKKKYRSVVYKRRLVLAEGDVMTAFAHNQPLPVQSQIGDEIAYFREYYGELKPKVFLSYEREAFYSLDGSDFRITFDDNILYRTEDLSLTSPPAGISILDQGRVLMEVKTSGGLPLWLTEALTANKIFKISFSKYGTAYADMMKHQTINKGVFTYA